jgi:putative inorganic carbon (HCO3(-)) transporter
MASLIRPPGSLGHERSQWTVIGLAALAAFGLSALAAAAGPVSVLAAVLLLAAAALVVNRPLLGAMAVYASFPVAYRPLPLGFLLLEVVVLATTGLVVLHRLVHGRTPLPWAPQMWWALFIVAAAVLATPSASNLQHAIRQDVLLVEGLLLALALPAACRSLQDLRKLIGVLLAVGVGVCAFGVITASSIKAEFGAAVVENRAQAIFDQPNDFANFAGVILMLAIGVSLGGRAKSTRRAAAVVIPICVGALALSLSRGSWIGTTFGSVLLLFVLPAARRAALRVALPSLIAVAVVIPLLPSTGPLEVVNQRLHTMLNPTSNPYDARPLIYQEAFREINQDPLTGQGPGNFPDSSRRTGSLTQHFGAVHAHDVLLTMAVEIGLPAVLLLIGMTIALGLLLLDAVRRLPDPKDRALVAGIGAALFFQVGQGIIDFNLRNHLLFILVWSLVGMLLVVRRARYQPEEERLP